MIWFWLGFWQEMLKTRNSAEVFFLDQLHKETIRKTFKNIKSECWL